MNLFQNNNPLLQPGQQAPQQSMIDQLKGTPAKGIKQFLIPQGMPGSSGGLFGLNGPIPGIGPLDLPGKLFK